MKFSMKILLSAMVVMTVAFGISGFFFINYVFDTALQREVNQALDESSILQFAFETAALNVPAKYDLLQDGVVEQIGGRLQASGQTGARILRITDEEQQVLFASEGFPGGNVLYDKVDEDTRLYQIVPHRGHYYVQTCSVIHVLDRQLCLETMQDVTDVFEERTLGFRVYRYVILAVLAISAVWMFALSSWLTRPIRILAGATRQMARGEYGHRARKVSDDELGELTLDYNKMANALEENIRKLEDEVRAREEFIAAFAHELKTPLTAIIGYADLLRSRRLDGGEAFLSANYIYTEGKRLEAMSFRLLDIIVTRRSEIVPVMVEASELGQYVEDMFEDSRDVQLVTEFEPGRICVEINLMKTVILNLVDNACKASYAGGRVEITGAVISGEALKERGYRISVKDYGVGIPPEELDKITEAFYMVDKSRSRSKNGAGLGLALCTEILRIHGSELQVESTPGQGTCMSFVLSGGEA